MYHQELKELIDKYVHLVYGLSRKFPREEIYGCTSQLRRSTLSVALNYLEGNARRRPLVFKNFLEIAYGSLNESRYLLEFSCKENYITQSDFVEANGLAIRIGAMLWGILSRL